MKEISVFRQPSKVIPATLLTFIYVVMVYVVTNYFSNFCDAVAELANKPERLWKMFGMYLVLESTMLIVKYCYDVGCIYIKERNLGNIRNLLLEQILTELRPEQYEHIGKERISGILVNDIKILGDRAIAPQMDLIRVFMRLFAFGILLFSYHVYVGLLAVVVSICIYLSSLPENKIVEIPSRALATAKEKYLQEYKEFLDCRTDYKYAGCDDYLKGKMESSNERLERSDYNLRQARIKVTFIHVLIRNVTRCLILATELLLVKKGNFSVGQILATISIFSLIEDDLARLQQVLESLSEATSVKARIQELVDSLKSSIPPSDKSDCNWHSFGVKCLSFGYEANLIHDMEVTFHRGKKYAIIGGSGSGKSTLLEILLGIQTGYQGSVYLNETELQPGSNAISEYAAYLGQDFHLFNNTIEANLYFGSPSRKKRLEASGFYTLVEHYLPDLNKNITDNGANLSGGQRQIVGIARAIAQGKDILILDESLSAADEYLFASALSVLIEDPNLTVIFVTHRLQNPGGFDHILELREGAIYEVAQTHFDG